MKFWLAGALGALVLAGCAGQQALVPQVQQGVDEGGAKTVTVAPYALACSQPSCPTLAAAWTSAKAGQAVLTVGLPYQQAQVTGADFHLGGEPVRVRSRSRAAVAAQGYPATAFDVPLRLVDAIAYTPRSWVRVYTADGRSVDEALNSGDKTSRAVEAMAYFITAVQGAAGGKAPGVEGGRGGLFDRLGVGGDGK